MTRDEEIAIMGVILTVGIGVESLLRDTKRNYDADKLARDIDVLARVTGRQEDIE